MHLKLLQQERFKKQHKQPLILLVIKSPTELGRFQKFFQRIIQKQMKKNYLERFMPSELRYKIFDNIRLNTENYRWFKISITLKYDIIMECQKLMNLLENTPNQLAKFRTRNLVEINDKSQATYNNNDVNNNNDIKFKTSMIRSILCDYSDAYILVEGTISVPNMEAEDVAVNNINKKVVFKNCAPFTNCITEINNTQIKNAEHIDIVIPMHDLLEYSDAYIRHQEVYGNTAENQL